MHLDDAQVTSQIRLALRVFQSARLAARYCVLAFGADRTVWVVGQLLRERKTWR